MDLQIVAGNLKAYFLFCRVFSKAVWVDKASSGATLWGISCENEVRSWKEDTKNHQ